ncbi:hypothetical protein Mgra_00007419 [Meloidogyne graminicola]|uniref:Uncharacterized protein n=1 Tax=Meloidogyne graminicola TaxID=189291 RepID=A0A8S9ZIP8_9BILA|nr:hypothetical protein Mgra_00007419 [Meloidogyne graminicola]
MLAPIVTKDMKLFPSQPLPARIKNVRSRAQSLQDFANGNAIHVSSSTAISSNTHLVIAANSARSRNSQSIGNLPTNTVLATSFQNTQNNNAVMIIPSAKTPPKYSTSSGVELSAAQGSSSTQDSVKDKKDAKNQNKKNKGLDIQSSSKNDATKKSKTFTHRSSHDDVLTANKFNSKDVEKKSKRTQSVERERKKKENKNSNNSSSITGCFTMWLNSKFRKNGGHNDDSSNNSSTKTTPEPLEGESKSK